ncbi:MAG: DUF3310 domain-containing protein [Cytophagaceae bacterium]|nr:MAG: DUF3310 domain-containing protein [Cytophagaceae bacterium]
MAENTEAVNHPQHYGGGDNPYEVIKIIDHYKLGFCLGNTIKYTLRAGKKDPAKTLEDLEKALWYLQHHIEKLKGEQ